MPHILIYNPNTNTEISENLAILASSQHPDWAVTTHTAPRGPRYIASASDLEEAEYVTLKTLTPDSVEGFDAILVACFGDPGVERLKETLSVPVFGMAEATFSLCADKAGSFSVVTGGHSWPPLLEALARRTGHNTAIDEIRAIPTFGEQAKASPSQTLDALSDAVRVLEVTCQTPHILLGGTGLAGFYDDLQRRISLPVTCSFRGSLEQMSKIFSWQNKIVDTF